MQCIKKARKKKVININSFIFLLSSLQILFTIIVMMIFSNICVAIKTENTTTCSTLSSSGETSEIQKNLDLDIKLEKSKKLDSASFVVGQQHRNEQLSEGTTNTQFATNIKPSAENICSLFNSIAMQFSLVQPGMQPPRDLEELKIKLWYQKPESISIITNYTWIYKNRILSTTAINDKLTNKLLTGNDDGSIYSKKIQQIYEKLKTATSVWIIKEINAQLGQGITSTIKLYRYVLRCKNGTIQINVDQDNNIKSAEIIYITNQDPSVIESQVGGAGHISWDIVIDSINQHQRGWKRTFTKPYLQ